MNQRNKPIRLVTGNPAPSYFEHNEKKSNPNVIALDVIEWPEPIEVKESDSDAARWNFRINWLNRIKGLLP
jgi:hypothetical protein